MRLIDADALKEAVNNKKVVGRFNTIQLIDNAPTIKDRSLEIAQKSIELGRKVGQLEGKLERPQGDLISRSELKKCAIPCEIHNGALTDLCVPLYQVDNAPTVSPERPQGEWIPVNERLPEEMQRVLIWFEYYRYGDFNCMYKTYGFGYVCDGKWSPFINGETGWQDYRVIAWMPLPEPYKKGGAE